MLYVLYFSSEISKSKSKSLVAYLRNICEVKETSWDWAGPSSAQAGITLYFKFLHNQNLTCNGWDITKNIIARHDISGRLAGGLAR